MPRQIHRTDDFGPRLRELRRERGWTQADLADRAGCTSRAINHYETSGQYPPAPVLAQLADTFGISMDALIGRTELRRPKPDADNPDLLHDSDDRRLWKKFQQLKELPTRDQNAVIHMLNGLLDARGKQRRRRTPAA